MLTTFEDVTGKSDYSQAGNGASSSGCGERDDKKLLEALRHSSLYRDYERTFMEATGLPLALRLVEFFGLPFHGKKNENAFCAFLAERKSCCALCLQTQARLNEARHDTPHSVQCPYGLTETVVPIVLGERIIGFLCTGQVFTRLTNGGASKSRSLRLSSEVAGLNAEGLRLWKRTRSMETAKYKATVRLLVFFAKQLSTLSNQLCIEQKSKEPAVVTRARQFIAENKRKPITLTTVAQASGASMFHFCTLFRATTGVKFTEYVARSRVEDARELLCNRRLRMCDVAYESGFQSLTAFHRAFQRILGQSPTSYRRGLSRRGGRVRSV
jgi:AraC-like DNA-binding protein/ligand-binding sensor protein